MQTQRARLLGVTLGKGDLGEHLLTTTPHVLVGPLGRDSTSPRRWPAVPVDAQLRADGLRLSIRGDEVALGMAGPHRGSGGILGPGMDAHRSPPGAILLSH